MKVYLTFKTPDVTWHALQDIDGEEDKATAEKAMKKWVHDGEYLDVVIDTDEGTCTPREA